jgi:hypothetical protein
MRLKLHKHYLQFVVHDKHRSRKIATATIHSNACLAALHVSVVARDLALHRVSSFKCSGKASMLIAHNPS